MINEINNNYLQVFSHYGVALRKRGATYVGLCPFHGEKNPSFSVREKDGRPQWICFSCGEKGNDAIAFVAAMEHTDRKGAIRLAAKAINVPMRETKEPRKDTDRPNAPVVFVPFEHLAAGETLRDKTELFKFLCGLYDRERVAGVFRKYRVGGVSWERGTIASAFPYINADGNCVDIHLQPYESDGKRWKQPRRRYCQDWFLRRYLKDRSGTRADWCVFGEHLLKERPDAPVGVVESEKTALIANLHEPSFIWVATGSAVNLNADRLRNAKGRDLYVFPDYDGVEQWRERCAELAKNGFNIFFCGSYIQEHATGAKCDLADIILHEHNDNGSNG